jgi:pimeloyl-ACP methyl ester carboxylesterase
MFSADLRARFDLIGWDPRGVGASNPIRCDPDLLAAAPSPHPASAAEFAALTAYNQTLARDCRSHTGPVFDHMDTASTARDVEAIRAALGAGRLNFYAMSYGTQIGEQYAELFPGHIRAMALDGVADHSAGAFGNATMLAQALEESYGQFADWCLRTPACALYPTDPRTVLDHLYTAALNGTITIPGRPDQVITPDVLLNYLRGQLMGSARWLGVAQELRAVLAETSRTTTAHAAPARTPAAATSPTPVASQDAAETFITCADHRWGISKFDQLQRLETAMNRVAPHTHFSTTALKEVTQCLGWPYPVDNPQHQLDVDGNPNILMISSRYDVATPYPGAINALRQIGRSANLLVYDGTSHADYPETPCVQQAVDTYLFTTHAPAPGTHCPAVYPDPHQNAGSASTTKPGQA